MNAPPGTRHAPSGVHWLIDCFDVDPTLLADAAALEALLRDAALDAGARILSSHVHRFGTGGVTGVVVLAESHVTIHTWPERAFAAIDFFLCGATDPARALARIEAAFGAARIVTTRCARGVIDP